MIFLDNLVKDFGHQRAVDHLSFEVKAGEVFGLLGPNGAGKTTTIRLLNGLFAATSGSARILGLDPVKDGDLIRSRVGVLTETPALYERLSAKENLLFFGKLCGISQEKLVQRVHEVLELFDLSGRANDLVAGFSKGMKQRMALSRAILHRPEVLYLDEPTSSLDPESALQVNELIRQFTHSDGSTVFLCTHNLLEAQRLCDRVAVIDKGRLLALGTPAELAHSLFPAVRLEVEFASILPEVLEQQLSTMPSIKSNRLDGLILHIQLSEKKDIPVLISLLASAGLQITRVQPMEVTLEEVYFSLQKQVGGVQ